MPRCGVRCDTWGGMNGAACRVWDVGCGVRGVGCGVWDVGCGVQGAGCGVQGTGCGVSGAGHTVGCGVARPRAWVLAVLRAADGAHPWLCLVGHAKRAFPWRSPLPGMRFAAPIVASSLVVQLPNLAQTHNVCAGVVPVRCKGKGGGLRLCVGMRKVLRCLRCVVGML